LRALIQQDEVRNGIVFCNRKTEVDIVAKSLKTHGLDAAPIHGDLDQSTRTKTLEMFRKGELKLLVASDVAARGLDIPDVSHVFNYDVPHHADDYVHRIGRTGRAGKSGATFMIVTPADSRGLDKVLKLIGKAPHEFTLDLPWDTLKDENRSSRSGSRERGRPTRERGGHGDRPQRAAPETEAAETVASPAVPSDIAPESAPRDRVRRERGRRAPAADQTPPAQASDSAPAQAEPRESRLPRESREPREPRREPRREAREQRPPRERDEGSVVGFGDDTPAFLTRATPPVSKSE
jgi:superfamily II DNA/RNA helicase